MKAKTISRFLRNLVRPGLLLLWAVGTVYSQQIPKGWKPFESSRSGYLVYYPPQWRPLFPNESNLEIVNFPPSSRVSGVVLPPGGALINVVGPPATRVATIEQWLAYDAGAGAQSQKTIILPRSNRESVKIVEVVQQPIEGEETVACYFDVSGRLLAGHAVYWKGDPNAAQYIGLLHKIIASAKRL